MNSNEAVSCINCGTKTRIKSFTILEQCPAVIAIFTQWLSPYILKENDVICKYCLVHAQKGIRNKLINTGQITDETQPLPSELLSQIDNRKVCVLCAKSLNKGRYKTLLQPNSSQNDQLTFNLLCQELLVPHKQIGADSLVCHNCWTRMDRKVDRMQADSTINQDAQNYEKQNNELQEECIELPSYRRSPDTSSRCVFENCPNQDLHSISDELRATLIKRHQYFMTAKARVCQQHLLRNNWDKLFDAENSVSTFKSDHIEHVLSFVATSKCTDIDFNNILDYDNNTVEYFLGLSKESFSVILKMLPELQDVENGMFGLMGLLIRHWNGGPNSKVAGLLKICPLSLETAMVHVMEILKYSPVTVNMGIDYLLKINK